MALGLADDAPGRVVRFGTGMPAPGDYGVVGADLVGPPGVLAALPASGSPHDVANALAAAAAALAVGADVDAVARALDGFGGLAHRVQLVGERGGVRYFDDSKATNPHATAGALAGFDHVVLHRRGPQQGPRPRRAARARAAAARGRRHRRGRGRGGVGVRRSRSPVVRAGSMHDAVRAAAEHAEAGDAVLLSPACASFDWYESYAARGDDFAREVTPLTDEPAGVSAVSRRRPNGEHA